MKIPNPAFLLASIFAVTLSVAPAADDKKSDADNTKKNERDRSPDQKTPGDQSNTPADIELTKTIRQAIVKDSSLTMTAKNIKIITIDGKVTLRGPVSTAEEKSKIEGIAKAAAGEGKFESQLEVKAAQTK